MANVGVALIFGFLCTQRLDESIAATLHTKDSRSIRRELPLHEIRVGHHGELHQGEAALDAAMSEGTASKIEDALKAGEAAKAMGAQILHGYTKLNQIKEAENDLAADINGAIAGNSLMPLTHEGALDSTRQMLDLPMKTAGLAGLADANTFNELLQGKSPVEPVLEAVVEGADELDNQIQASKAITQSITSALSSAKAAGLEDATIESLTRKLDEAQQDGTATASMQQSGQKMVNEHKSLLNTKFSVSDPPECRWDFPTGEPGTAASCASAETVHEPIQCELACQLASDNPSQPCVNGTNYFILEGNTDDAEGQEQQDDKPHGCYKADCPTDSTKKCYFYNKAGHDGTAPEKTSGLVGVPVCRRAKYEKGTAVLNANVTCPQGYEVIYNEHACHSATLCLGDTWALHSRIGLKNASHHDLFPEGCFIHATEINDANKSIVYFNPPQDPHSWPSSASITSHTPICIATSTSMFTTSGEVAEGGQPAT